MPVQNPPAGSLEKRERGPNILLITTDEERARLPVAPGYSLPARERLGEAGLSKGSIFWHFNNKENLFRAVINAIRGALF